MAFSTETEVNKLVGELVLPDQSRITVSDFKRYGELGWEWKYTDHKNDFLSDLVFHTDKQGLGFYVDFDAGLSFPMTITLALGEGPVVRRNSNPLDTFIQIQATLFAFMREKTPCQPQQSSAL